jgi:tRNA (guanine-N7-)-methyltransferase
MRRKRNLSARTAACSRVLAGRLENYRGGEGNIEGIIDFERLFGNKNPVCLEIGCGRGKFIRETAALRRDMNFIALEKSENVLITALELAVKENAPNLRFILGRAEELGGVIAPGGAARIFLNFCCPYPKNAHAKRRLTHPRFLEIYREILADGGVIELKTDDADFFDFSAGCLAENGFTLTETLADLRGGGGFAGVTSEYEDMFAALGKPVRYLSAVIARSR